MLVRFCKPGLFRLDVNIRQIEESWEFKHAFDLVMLSPRAAEFCSSSANTLMVPRADIRVCSFFR
jgi:hypothetical protein